MNEIVARLIPSIIEKAEAYMNVKASFAAAEKGSRMPLAYELRDARETYEAAVSTPSVIGAICRQVQKYKDEIDDLKKPIPCGVCGGRPLASGRECVCKGVGTEQAEMQGLREMVFELQEELAKCEQK